MTLNAEARRRRFHQYGPWALVIGVAVIALLVQAVRRHAIHASYVYYFLVLVPSIVLHEVSHGFVANLFGDDTAKRAGRLTLNPLRHIDPVGTIVLPALLLFFGAPAFGWAKPVPVSVNRLRHPRNQSVLVSLAGPATNLVIAAAAGFALMLTTHSGATLGPSLSVPFQLLFLLGVANVIVAIFNLIPIPPLDGSAVIERFLPASALPRYYQLRQLSMVLILLLVFFGGGFLNSLFDHALTTWQRIWLPNY
ncbi:MAG TPA: site-2 protease family protein [Acidimicrobiales bacterium]|nr:site-2 protease family protein [Acidimicrobiales bacterium]